ncbi:MAG TPA: 2-phospho-L-lactate guanylyltransferase [Solirubrobacteraceae bacterium]|jgi:2-phospho-L-lactate guanylyltransferase|nr:2-phospho-L-lactate guanylyltransferase [Solirubrobacteraceae bacterium]
MRTAAILPVKRFSVAKQRLGASVAEPLRLQLARAMVADVLAALAETESNEITIVVTREESVARAASRLGAIVIDDVADAGQSAAAELGVRRALAEGIERIVCVPGDCPALDPEELEQLLEPGGRAGADRGRGAGEVVIVPDRHGTGTNGLLLSPPDAISPSFGPGSFERHHALALAAGLPCRVERPPSLLLDIDTGADLAALRERLAADQPEGRIARATRTRAVLGGADGVSRLPLTTPA